MALNGRELAVLLQEDLQVLKGPAGPMGGQQGMPQGLVFDDGIFRLPVEEIRLGQETMGLWGSGKEVLRPVAGIEGTVDVARSKKGLGGSHIPGGGRFQFPQFRPNLGALKVQFRIVGREIQDRIQVRDGRLKVAGILGPLDQFEVQFHGPGSLTQVSAHFGQRPKNFRRAGLFQGIFQEVPGFSQILGQFHGQGIADHIFGIAGPGHSGGDHLGDDGVDIEAGGADDFADRIQAAPTVEIPEHLHHFGIGGQIPELGPAIIIHHIQNVTVGDEGANVLPLILPAGGLHHQGGGRDPAFTHFNDIGSQQFLQGIAIGEGELGLLQLKKRADHFLDAPGADVIEIGWGQQSGVDDQVPHGLVRGGQVLHQTALLIRRDDALAYQACQQERHTIDGFSGTQADLPLFEIDMDRSSPPGDAQRARLPVHGEGLEKVGQLDGPELSLKTHGEDHRPSPP